MDMDRRKELKAQDHLIIQHGRRQKKVWLLTTITPKAQLVEPGKAKPIQINWKDLERRIIK